MSDLLCSYYSFSCGDARECCYVSKAERRASTRRQEKLPAKEFTRPPENPTTQPPSFSILQLDYYYRVPGEFTHRLTGDKYGFESLSFIITETHPGGGPGLHVHDTEEAHVLLNGTAQYRIGDKTFTVGAPYIAKVPAGVPHTFINAGSSQFNLIAVFASKHPNTRRVGPNPLIRARENKEEPRSGSIIKIVFRVRNVSKGVGFELR